MNISPFLTSMLASNFLGLMLLLVLFTANFRTLHQKEKENKILIFRTSITKRCDIKRIGKLLAEFPQIDKWNVDFEDWEKILRIECSGITALEISEVLRNNHIFVSELE